MRCLVDALGFDSVDNRIEMSFTGRTLAEIDRLIIFWRSTLQWVSFNLELWGKRLI